MQLPAAKPVQHCHGFPSRGTPALQLPRCAAPSPIAAPCQGCPTLQWQWRRRQRPRHCRQSSGRAPDARQPIETFLQHCVESGAAAPLVPGRSSRDRRRYARQCPAAPPRQLRARRRPPKPLWMPAVREQRPPRGGVPATKQAPLWPPPATWARQKQPLQAPKEVQRLVASSLRYRHGLHAAWRLPRPGVAYARARRHQQQRQQQRRNQEGPAAPPAPPEAV
mmetsp:Transcript_86855/g.280600  ORF Transcript_86855/g.280600 Transcript_86855/m.280600 type:complete len:222 (-) Transcript_86855:315-980(-)